MAVFTSSDNKHVVRRLWNLPVIRIRSQDLGRKLTYLGMPGPEIGDLIDWRDYLDRIRTAVELDRDGAERQTDKANQRRILDKVMEMEGSFASGFELRQGWIEDLLIKGVDKFGRHPQLGDGYTDGSLRYDLINLDFCGGIGYEGKRVNKKRVKALRELAEKQQNTDFLLVLTLNVRDNMGQELIEYLEGTRYRHYHDKTLTDALKWYAKSGKGKKSYVLKAAVPLFIQQEFEIYGYKVFCYPPIMYEGTGQGSRLVNFMFDAKYKTGSSFPVVSQQNPIDLINLPMMEVSNDQILFAEQHPNFDFPNAAHCLDFLDQDLRLKINLPTP